MSKFEKAKRRILTIPADYSYKEVKYLLEKMGFQEFQKGKTSGSRVIFYKDLHERIIMLHKPHPSDIMKKGAVEELVKKLKEWGEL